MSKISPFCYGCWTLPLLSWKHNYYSVFAWNHYFFPFILLHNSQTYTIFSLLHSKTVKLNSGVWYFWKSKAWHCHLRIKRKCNPDTYCHDNTFKLELHQCNIKLKKSHINGLDVDAVQKYKSSDTQGRCIKEITDFGLRLKKKQKHIHIKMIFSVHQIILWPPLIKERIIFELESCV